MSITQDEAITVQPLGVTGRVGHNLPPEQMCHGSASHGSTWMTTVGGFGLIRTDSTNSIDAFMLQRGALIVGGHDVDNRLSCMLCDRNGSRTQE